MKKSVAIAIRAALVVAGVAAAQSAFASADDGVKCRSGFNASFSNGVLKCSKQVVRSVSLDGRTTCPNDSKYPNYVVLGGNRRDVCVAPGVDIDSDTDLSQLENGIIEVKIPVGRPLPVIFGNRLPIKVAGTVRHFQLKRDGDFIFFDQSQTAQAIAKAQATATDAATAASLNVPRTEVDTRVTKIAAQKDAGQGSRDKLEVDLQVFSFAREQ